MSFISMLLQQAYLETAMCNSIFLYPTQVKLIEMCIIKRQKAERNKD